MISSELLVGKDYGHGGYLCYIFLAFVEPYPFEAYMVCNCRAPSKRERVGQIGPACPVHVAGSSMQTVADRG
jgi:hypothetical protein